MEIGAQLYTVRNHCQTKEDLTETLKKVAGIGYRFVQVSGTCEYEPEWLGQELKKNGLQCVITHIPQNDLLTQPKQVAANHCLFDCDYVGLGYYPFDDPEKDFHDFVERFTPVVNTLKQEGKYFMYHNHAKEFQKIKGVPILEHLANQFSADVFGFTLDTYWVQTAGGDPAYWLERLSRRVPCIHLKDHTFDRKMAVLGEGNIHFDRVFLSAEQAGTKYMLVEQDDCNGEDPFDCLERSYKFLKSRGFA